VNVNFRRRLIVAPAAPVYSAPLLIDNAAITANGSNVFTGNWENASYSANNGAAVYVSTTQAVVIQNSRFKAQKYCVSSLTNGSNVTVRNCIGVVNNTTQASQPRQRFLNLGQPATVVCENNTMVGGGILLQDNATGGTTLVRILYNKAINIDGRLSDGAGGYVFEVANNANIFFQAKQFLQINGLTGSNVEVAWNAIGNEPYVSRPEDVFNFYDAAGTVGSPMQIHDNFIYGGWPSRPHEITWSGCGFLVEQSVEVAQYINIDDNQVVGIGNAGIGINTCNHINIRRNRLVSAGNVEGRQIKSRNRAAYSTGASSTYIVWQNNGFSWVDASNVQQGLYITNAGNAGNSNTGWYSLGATTLEANEQAEVALWKAKLAARRLTLGSSLGY
jgi:hypothetical protein